MTITILHETSFEYVKPVSASFTEARLRPASDADQTCHEFSLSVDPLRPITTGVDYFGNVLHTFNILDPHRALVVTGHSVVETHRDPFRKPNSTDAFAVQRAQVDFLGFDGPVDHCPAVTDLAREAGLMGRGLMQQQVMGTMRQSQSMFTDHFAAAQKLNGLIHKQFAFAPDATDVNTLVSHVMQNGRGVCQDFAHIFLAACREAGFPARYVSGYLVTRRSRSAEGAMASHAWAEVLLPGIGWCAFDPTNNLLPNNYYVKIAVGRDYRDVPPTRGVFKGAGVESRLRVRVYTVVHEEEAAAERQPDLVG